MGWYLVIRTMRLERARASAFISTGPNRIRNVNRHRHGVIQRKGELFFGACATITDGSFLIRQTAQSVGMVQRAHASELHAHANNRQKPQIIGALHRVTVLVESSGDIMLSRSREVTALAPLQSGQNGVGRHCFGHTSLSH